MDDKAVNNEVKTETSEAAPENKRKLSGGHLALIVVGVCVAVFFVALIVWISVGARAKEEKKKSAIKVVAAEVKPKFTDGGARCVVTLPTLKRGERDDVTPTIDLVLVKAGSFTMSEPPTTYTEKVKKDGRIVEDTKARENEKPHKVTLKHDFYIGATEVTQAQWMAVMGVKENGAEEGKEKKSYFSYRKDGDHPNGSDDLPVETVSWNEAMAFCEKLNESGFAPEGWRFTLPTETQWEFAARGGNSSKGYKYSGSDNLREVAWCKSNNNTPRDRKLTPEEEKDGDKRDKNRPVAQKKPNELGLYDMSGNVWEWCLDDFPSVEKTVSIKGREEKSRTLGDSSMAVPEFTRGYTRGGISRVIAECFVDPEKIPPEFRPQSLDGSPFRVIRGGSWYTNDESCTVTVRGPMSPGGRGFYLGFRIVLVRKFDPAK